MPSPDVASPDLAEALLHGQFSGWSRAGGGSSDGNGCPNSPGGGGAKYALTLTHSHLHVQRLSVRPGREARLLLPLAELLGCSCPRHPAPPLLLLYWYPSGRRRKGVSRRRQVRAYLAESRPDAERWCAAVQCLLRGVPVCAATEFNKGLLPRPRRLLLLVNPFSGRGQAMQWCQSHILPMIREASISYNLIQTERQNHAKELVREISLAEWDGIVIVSGDGLLHEVINGLMERPDWEEAIKTPVGILPCGSGNALAGSINHHAGYDMCLREPLLLNCCFLLCRGCVRPMDLVSVTTSRPASNQNGWPTQRRLFSFLSVAWGFVSDVDIESERYRGLGSARFTLGTLVRLASLRSYKGRLSYLPPTAVTASPDATPPPQKRLLSRSITEGLEGFSRTPIHRTISDMGLSEQRSLRKGDEEGERERQKEECERERQKEECERERQKERERRRERRRGRARGGGVTRASSLAEDREREREAESEQGGGDAQEGSPPEKDGRTEVGMEDPDSDDREDESATDGKDGSLEDVLEAVEASEQYGAGTGKDECDSCYQERREQRKNSAPSSQIVSAICGPPKAPGPQLECDSGYCAEEAQLNGTYAFPRQPFTLEMRERALTISSPFRHITRSYKPKSVDQNQNSSRPRPLSLLQSNSNSLPPKLSLSMSPPTPPSSPPAAPSLTSTYLAPRPGSPGSASPSPSLRSPSPSFTFDVAEPAGPVKTRTAISEVYAPPRDDLLPPLDQPLPTRDWVTVEGDFVLVLAIYQSHLGADLLAAPQARFDDGLIHLTFVRAGISRATLLRLFLAMERGAHLSLSSPYVSHVSAKAFRLQPLSPRGTLTVDGELVPYGPLQAQVHPSMARLIVGDPGVKITRL